jgi:hypothetical protein
VTVLDLDTGKVRFYRDYPGQFIWTVSVGTLGTHRAGVVVPGTSLSAFDAGTGATLWTYRPPVASYFSNAAIVHGVTVAEYQNQATEAGPPPTTMAAVGIAATGKVAWTAPASPKYTYRADLWNGVYGGPGIQGAGTTGVALEWLTTSGGGRVDVRDALTGALIYHDGNQNLFGHQGWALDPKLGLISLDSSAVLIEPGGRSVDTGLTLNSASVVGSAAAPVLLGGYNSVGAYPASTLRDLEGQPAASNYTFTPSTIVPAGPVKGEGQARAPGQAIAPGEAGGRQVIALPEDLLAMETVDYDEAGDPGHLLPSGTELGLDLLTATGAPPAVTAPVHRVRSASPRPTTVSLAGPARPGVWSAQPQAVIKVRGYTSAGKAVLAGSTPDGYDPAIMRAYLGLTGDGAGQTVAIVDAYRDPAIETDVNAFSKRFGLPQVCDTSSAPRTLGTPHTPHTPHTPRMPHMSHASGVGQPCFDFSAIAPGGTPAVDPSWAVETSLDVEWLHALAPDATIRLVEARTSIPASLFAAVSAAAALHPDAISMSWGGTEFSAESFYNWHCQLAHSVCVVSTGDSGYPGGYPAYNPHVLAVGGTTLDLNPSGTVASEVSWAGSGGGMSYFQSKPAVQQGVSPGGRRGIPDVSYDADPDTGVAIYDTVPYQGEAGWYDIGGTSVGAPSWSAILTDADQLRAAAGKPRLTSAGDAAARAVYAATSALASITSGPPNGACPKQCQPGPGYDFVTGIGSPRSGIDKVIAAEP